MPSAHDDRCWPRPTKYGPLVATLAAALRDALTAIHIELTTKTQAAVTTLANDTTWSALNAEVQDETRRLLHLQIPPGLSIGTDEDLRRTLDACPLHAWRSEVDAVDARTAHALDEAAQYLQASEPDLRTTTIRVRRGTLADETAVAGVVAGTGGKTTQTR